MNDQPARQITAEFIPVTGIRPGHRIAGGVVTATRTSKSGKTVFITYMSDGRGVEDTYSQSARTRAAVFTYED